MLKLNLANHNSIHKILCLGAHSDDIEIGCGGSLLRLLGEHPGSTVWWLVLSATEERATEAQAGAAAFTATGVDAATRTGYIAAAVVPPALKPSRPMRCGSTPNPA